jgi:hypothetical protein
MNFMKVSNKEFKNLLIYTIVIIILVTTRTINLQEKDDRIIYNSFGSSLRIFNLMMDDYNKVINNTEDIDEKVAIIKDLGIRLDRLQLSFSYIEDRFNLSFNPLVHYVLGYDWNKFKLDSFYNTEALNKIDKSYIISTKIKDMGYDDFYKNAHRKLLRIKPSDKIVDYFNEMNKLALQG